LYDPTTDEWAAKSKALFNYEGIDDLKPKGPLGLYPGKGGFHINHRIDGKLVAVSFVDITTKYFNSGYFIYDPDYAFLNLGVVSVIKEIEYMRFV
jgi:arginyl-tRNA--protein-N-Asp/Glu arginylyltransferase